MFICRLTQAVHFYLRGFRGSSYIVTRVPQIPEVWRPKKHTEANNKVMVTDQLETSIERQAGLADVKAHHSHALYITTGYAATDWDKNDLVTSPPEELAKRMRFEPGASQLLTAVRDGGGFAELHKWASISWKPHIIGNTDCKRRYDITDTHQVSRHSDLHVSCLGIALDSEENINKNWNSAYSPDHCTSMLSWNCFG